MAEAGKTAKSDALGSEKISRLVLRYTATTFTALLLHSVYNLTDALFVSWGVGSNAMGGVSVAFPFVILQGAIATAVGSGAASIVSRRLGAGKSSQAGEVTLNAMLVFYCTAVLTTVLGLLLMDPMLQLMGVTSDLYIHARQYLVIILLGNVFSTGFSSIIRAEGKMLYALLIWVIPVSVNIALDTVFILGLGMGVQGSALATVLCQFTSFCMSLLFFARFSTQRFKGARPSPAVMGEIVATGFPSLVQMGSLSVVSVVLNNVLRQAGGTLGVNTYAYISKIVVFAVMPFSAVTQALAPIAGYNYGRGNWARVKKAGAFCLLLSLLYAAVAFALVQGMPGTLLRAFAAGDEIVRLGTAGLRIIALSFFFTPLPLLAGAGFQAMGKKAWALVMYAANLAFLLPFVFSLPGLWGLNGVWWAYVFSNICASLLVLAGLPALRKIGAGLKAPQAP